MRFVNSLTALTLMLGAVSGTAHAYNVQTVSDPSGQDFIQLLGINNNGVIVGTNNATTPQAFSLTLPNTFSPQNFPGSSQSMATGINGNGDISGIYVDVAGVTHAFTKIGFTFQTIDQPGTAFNQALGINNSNTTVGYSSLDPLGQTLQIANMQTGGVFSNINGLPVNVNSQAVGINNANDIVGFYQPTSTTSLGFLDHGGVITTLDPFGSTFTQALGINNLGEIVGFYTDNHGIQHGYVDNNNIFTSFDPNGSTGTTINGLNDLGQIVGFYNNANHQVIGFVGTPSSVPEPTTLAMLSIGLLGLAAKRQRLNS